MPTSLASVIPDELLHQTILNIAIAHCEAGLLLPKQPFKRLALAADIEDSQ